jgi:hypothetical protein
MITNIFVLFQVLKNYRRAILYRRAAAYYAAGLMESKVETANASFCEHSVTSPLVANCVEQTTSILKQLLSRQESVTPPGGPNSA